MAHDVFISHSSKDKIIADAICAGLEARGIRCWMAPRDVLPGQEWTQAIVDAITASKIFLLVFTENSNQSHQAIKEVDCAVNDGITILPFRLEEITPSGSMKYYLSSLHWLDAVTPPLEEHIEELAEFISQIIKKPISSLSTSEQKIRKKDQKQMMPNWIWLAVSGMTMLGIIAAALILGDKIRFTAQPMFGTQTITSTLDFTPTITKTVELFTPTFTPTLFVTATPELIAVKMLKGKYCYATTSDDSPVLHTYSKGDRVILSGQWKIEEGGGGWLNVRQEGLTDHWGSFDDCWIRNSDLEVVMGGGWNELPVATPRHVSYMRYAASCDLYHGDSNTSLQSCTGSRFYSATKDTTAQWAKQYCSLPFPLCTKKIRECKCRFWEEFFSDNG